MDTTIAQLVDAIAQHDNFIVTAHHNPDGDALGAMCAMGYILSYLNKRYVLYNISGIPQHLSHIPLPSTLYMKMEDIPHHFSPESSIILDVSDPKRVGEELYSILPSLYSINIDHHASCPHFADINYITPSHAATGCIVALIAEHCNIPLTGGLGECLYLSITEDTGNFRNTNTDSESLRFASDIVKHGLDIADFVHRYQNQWSYTKMQLWGYLLSSCTQYYEGRVFISQVPLSLLQQYNLCPEDIDGINSFLMHINTARIAISLREVEDDQYHGIKASFRSYNCNVLPLVQHFGGGGHKNAAGAFFQQKTLEEVELTICNTIPHFITFE